MPFLNERRPPTDPSDKEKNHLTRFEDAAARLRKQKKAITEDSLALEVHVSVATVRYHLRYHPDFARDVGLEAPRSGEAMKNKTRLRYLEAAGNIKNRKEKLTYQNLAVELGLQEETVRHYRLSHHALFAEIGLMRDLSTAPTLQPVKDPT